MEGLTRLNPPVTGLMQVRHAGLPRFPSWQCVAMLFFFYSPGTLFLLSSNPAFAVSPAGSDVSSRKQYLAQGWRWFQQVALDQAITSWVEAAHLYRRAGKPNKQSETVTYLSQAYQSIGQYRQALQNLESALALVKKLDNRTRMASVIGSLGNVYIATGPAETAYGYLHQSLGMARGAGDSALAAGILNNLGNLFTSQKQYTEALREVRDPSVSRAIVLQRAQLKLLHDPRYQHPGYWFPFLLINNWL